MAAFTAASSYSYNAGFPNQAPANTRHSKQIFFFHPVKSCFSRAAHSGTLVYDRSKQISQRKQDYDYCCRPYYSALTPRAICSGGGSGGGGKSGSGSRES